MWKIQTISESNAAVMFSVSGTLRADQVKELRTLLGMETRKVTFDMKEVGIVDREMVDFLSDCAAGGIELKNCPHYIEQWIERARSSRSKSNPAKPNK